MSPVRLPPGSLCPSRTSARRSTTWAYSSRWGTTSKTNFRGVEIWKPPPQTWHWQFFFFNPFYLFNFYNKNAIKCAFIRCTIIFFIFFTNKYCPYINRRWIWTTLINSINCMYWVSKELTWYLYGSILLKYVNYLHRTVFLSSLSFTFSTRVIKS